MSIFLFLFSLERRIQKILVINQTYISKLKKDILYIENQNMLELQIPMFHFLVVLMLMQFYVILL